MKCGNAIALIDQFFDDELPQLPEELKSHLAACPSCNQYFNAGEKALALSTNIRRASILVNEPETFADSIMNSLGEQQKSGRDNNRGLVVSMVLSSTFRRLVAAAAILLFAVFSYEQYIVLDKVNQLENQYVQSSVNKHWEIGTMKKYRQFRIIQSSIYAKVMHQHEKKGNKTSGIFKLLLSKNSAFANESIKSVKSVHGPVSVLVSGH
jgi:hypothetical protein